MFDQAMRARLALVVGVVAISFAAVFFRETAPMHPLIAAGLRLTLAALALSPWVLRRWRTLSPAMRRDAVIAGLFYAVHFGTWVTSLTLTSVAASVTLVTATPILLAVIALATRRDRPSLTQLVAIGFAMLGVALIGWRDLGAEGALAGDLLALAGAAAMAGYLLIARRHGDKLDVAVFTGIACAIGGIVLLATATALGVPIEIPSTRSGAFVVLAALVPQLIGHTALTWALRTVPPTTVGLATVVEPVGATLLAWLWLREEPAALTLVGCAVTLLAVLLSFRRR